jgi:hypothetical protein
MKRNTFYLLILLTFISGTAFSQKTIEITNQYPFERINEMVEIDAKDFGDLKSANFILKDENNVEVPYQLIFKGNDVPQSIVFPATVKEGKKVVYTIVDGKPKSIESKTFARFVPERKDDFAWENDLAAYRVYGPALLNENPSNGVDLWLKRTEELIVDSFYRGEIKHKKSYHVDHGQGLDCYKVGKTLGAGGIAPYQNGTLWIGNHFNSYKVLDNGPLRSIFTLTYDTVNINGKTYKQEITITTDAGTTLNKAVVKYIGERQLVQLATGIALHNGKGKLQKSTGLMIYGENALANADNSPVGQSYVGIVLPNPEDGYKILNVNGLHALYLSNHMTGNEFTYYFGGGWSKWKFPTQADWLTAVQQFSKQVKYPLSIKVVEAPAAI